MALEGGRTADEDLDFLDSSSAQDARNTVPVAAVVDDDGPSHGAQRGQQDAQQGVVELFHAAAHPRTAFFHVAFKALALFLYVFGSWFSDSFVVIFVFCVLCLSADFWTVKNVSGRLLVGLRWWNELDADGNNAWRFESIENPDEINSADYRIFWYSMYLNMVLWAILGFLDLLSWKFDWLLLVGVALALTGSNIYGYWQCSKDARQRFEGAVQGVVTQSAISALSSSFSSGLSRMTGRGEYSATPTTSQA